MDDRTGHYSGWRIERRLNCGRLFDSVFRRITQYSLRPPGVGQMYQQNSVSQNPITPSVDPIQHPLRISPRPRASLEGADVSVVEDASAATSLNQLRSLVTELFRALDETLRENREGAEERLQRIAGLIGDVDAQPQTTPTKIPQGGLAPWQLRRVLSHIEANLDTTIRNTDLALLVHLSPFYFNVAFRRSTGNSPREYIIRRRIERAQGLMLSTDASLSDIAITCGHADQPHFTRLFKKVVGESPAAWRRARANPRP
jgi:AraC family transcriptional regulator